jgi:hypothetical protein
MPRLFDRLSNPDRPFANRRSKPKAALRLERLEDRATPARMLWAGPDWGFWDDPANWVDPQTEQPLNAAPGPEDDVLIDGERFPNSSVTGDVTAIRSLEVINFVHAITVDDGDDVEDPDAELTISGPCRLSLSQGIVVHGIFRGDETGSPADIFITGEGAGLNWRGGDIDNIHFVLDFGTDSLISVGGDSGGGHSSLTSSIIENFGDVEVTHTILGLDDNTIINAGTWLLNDFVWAWFGGNSDFINAGSGIFQVIGPVNYWYFDVQNFGAVEIGGTYPFVNYIGLAIFDDFDQGTPGIAILPAPYTRISYGGSMTVGRLMEETFSVDDGAVIVDGAIKGTVETAPGTAFVAGTYDFSTDTYGSGNAVIQNGSITIGGVLWITVDHLQNGMVVASRLLATGEDVFLGPFSALIVFNTGATPDDNWEQEIIVAENVFGEFGGPIFAGLTFWFDENGVPHTWFVERVNAPFYTRYILKVVSPEDPPPGPVPPIPGGPGLPSIPPIIIPPIIGGPGLPSDPPIIP